MTKSMNEAAARDEWGNPEEEQRYRENRDVFKGMIIGLLTFIACMALVIFLLLFWHWGGGGAGSAGARQNVNVWVTPNSCCCGGVDHHNATLGDFGYLGLIPKDQPPKTNGYGSQSFSPDKRSVKTDHMNFKPVYEQHDAYTVTEPSFHTHPENFFNDPPKFGPTGGTTYYPPNNPPPGGAQVSTPTFLSIGIAGLALLIIGVLYLIRGRKYKRQIESRSV